MPEVGAKKVRAADHLACGPMECGPVNIEQVKPVRPSIEEFIRRSNDSVIASIHRLQGFARQAYAGYDGFDTFQPEHGGLAELVETLAHNVRVLEDVMDQVGYRMNG